MWGFPIAFFTDNASCINTSHKSKHPLRTIGLVYRYSLRLTTAFLDAYTSGYLREAATVRTLDETVRESLSLNKSVKYTIKSGQSNFKILCPIKELFTPMSI
ncbi:hypothetical protein CDAR_187891 [Caerostris darwini]|uniref:Reverse transcriptase RNase H-like domain-containing protein n=1 Tax=Caerostris darwini TaxID=1538125 RepID=A0AAV4R4T2_9ARAC|nr:hypothetical protein CDAR_187891 [Caerostris darwini]